MTAASDCGSGSRFYCGLVRERGTVRTAATKVTELSCSNSTNCSIERVA